MADIERISRAFVVGWSANYWDTLEPWYLNRYRDDRLVRVELYFNEASARAAL